METSQAEAISQRLPVGDYIKDAERTLLITSDQVYITSYTIFIVSILLSYVCCVLWIKHQNVYGIFTILLSLPQYSGQGKEESNKYRFK